MDLEFSGEIFLWRGPAPHHFVAVPQRESDEIESESRMLSYGWGCIPVQVRIGDTTFTTSLFPKDGRYLVPIKAAVRKGEGLELGDEVRIQMALGG